MDSYMNHLLILDEFTSPYGKNNWNKHHQDTGDYYLNGTLKKINPDVFKRAREQFKKDMEERKRGGKYNTIQTKFAANNAIGDRTYLDYKSRLKRTKATFRNTYRSNLKY